MQTLQTEFGEPDRQGRSSKLIHNQDRNDVKNQGKSSVGIARKLPGNIPHTRQLSNNVRNKMTSAKEKIRSTTPNTGFIAGLLYWIPGFGGGKQNHSTMSTKDFISGKNENAGQNRMQTDTNPGEHWV